MKTWGTILIATALLMNAGCASEKAKSLAKTPTETTTDTDSNTEVPGAPTGTGNDPDETGFESGSTAEFTVSGGVSTMKELFYNWPTGSACNTSTPKDFRVNIDMNRVLSSDPAERAVIVSYMANGTRCQASFGGVHPDNPGVSSTIHNKVYTHNGKTVYKAFLQDRYTAVVIIIDQMIGQGDGQLGDILGGEIWFQNFDKAYPKNPIQGPLKMCWDITMGNHDCRTFMVGSAVDPSSSYYPNNKGPNQVNSYKKLGTFYGISRDHAGF
ncbi:MAG TPA: hypothetical protein VM432_08450 [Bdellovibrionales bacterium]|jgi:hypothetical protein|nr:hypothetical protein [Bdellovibrionales bacterium]